MFLKNEAIVGLLHYNNNLHSQSCVQLNCWHGHISDWSACNTLIKAFSRNVFMSTCSNKNVDDTQSSECIWLLFSCLHLLWTVTPTLLTECDFKKQTLFFFVLFLFVKQRQSAFSFFLYYIWILKGCKWSNIYMLFVFFLVSYPFSHLTNAHVYVARLRTAALGCGFVL